MNRETKSFSFDLKEMSEDEDKKVGTVKGYASTFGNIDLGNDIIESGAFRKTLNEKNVFPFLADHRADMNNLLGYGRLREDDKGLFGEFEVNLETPQGKSAYALIKQANKAGDNLGMSIGFDIPKGKAEYDTVNDVRRIKEVKLYEVSLTMFPMNQMAGITDAKGFTEEDLQQVIKTAKQLLSLRKNEPSTDTQDDEAELTELLNTIKETNGRK